MTEMKKVVVLKGRYQKEFPSMMLVNSLKETIGKMENIGASQSEIQKKKDELEIVSKEQDWLDEIVSANEKHEDTLFGDSISTTGAAIMILRKGMIVELPTEMAVQMVQTRIAKPFVEVDPDYGFAPEPEPAPLPKEVLTDQGDFEDDIEKQIKANLGRETAKSKRKK